jgi:hypothetical protein
MTNADKILIDKHIDSFTSFMDFVKFTYDHEIEFTHDEWEFYRDRLRRFLETKKISSKEFNGLILPQNI